MSPLSILPAFIPVGIVAAVVIGIYFFTRKNHSGPSFEWTQNTWRASYGYLILLASIVMFAIGWGNVNQGVLGYAFGDEFAYRAEYVPCLATSVDPDAALREATCPETYEYDSVAKQRDLVQGITLMIFAVLIGLAHWMIVRRAPQTREVKMIEKTFVLVGLVVFGITSLIAVPMGIFSTVNYLLSGAPEVKGYVQDSSIPGISLATAIAFTPIWIGFLLRFLKIPTSKSE